MESRLSLSGPLGLDGRKEGMKRPRELIASDREKQKTGGAFAPEIDTYAEQRSLGSPERTHQCFLEDACCRNILVGPERTSQDFLLWELQRDGTAIPSSLVPIASNRGEQKAGPQPSPSPHPCESSLYTWRARPHYGILVQRNQSQ